MVDFRDIEDFFYNVGYSIRNTLEEDKKPSVDRAFKKGAEELSGVSVVFVDPDAIASTYFQSPEDNLREQLESQAPGITETVLEHYNSDRDKPIALRDISLFFQNNSPLATFNVMHRAENHCIVVEPSIKFDTKSEIITNLLIDHNDLDIDTIIKNSPGSDEDWIGIISDHEIKGHCTEEKARRTRLDVLNAELRADRVANNEAVDEGKGDIVQAYNDVIRHLGSGTYRDDGLHDSAHATGVLLHSDEQASGKHVHIAGTYKRLMDNIVQQKIDGISYDWESQDYSRARDILKENPEFYFSVVNEYIEQENHLALKGFNDHKGTEDYHLYTGIAISAEIFDNYAHNYEDAYRRRMLGQDIPEREPTRLLPPEVVEEYYQEHERRYGKPLDNKVENKEPDLSATEKNYEQGVDGTAYTTHVSNLPTGDVKVGFDEEGVNVDDNSLPNVFNQHVNPPYENISVVNAKIENNIDQKLDLPQFAKNDDLYQNQNLG